MSHSIENLVSTNKKYQHLSRGQITTRDKRLGLCELRGDLTLTVGDSLLPLEKQQTDKQNGIKSILRSKVRKLKSFFRGKK